MKNKYFLKIIIINCALNYETQKQGKNISAYKNLHKIIIRMFFIKGEKNIYIILKKR